MSLKTNIHEVIETVVFCQENHVPLLHSGIWRGPVLNWPGYTNSLVNLAHVDLAVIRLR